MEGALLVPHFSFLVALVKIRLFVRWGEIRRAKCRSILQTQCKVGRNLCSCKRKDQAFRSLYAALMQVVIRFLLREWRFDFRASNGEAGSMRSAAETREEHFSPRE